MGEGVTDPKGTFGTTAGLVERFGPRRVLEMPVAENGFTGVAIGAAMMGQRPIVIHQRVEFSLLAFEQLANNAAKMHYVSGGKHARPAGRPAGGGARLGAGPGPLAEPRGAVELHPGAQGGHAGDRRGLQGAPAGGHRRTKTR